MCVCEGYKYIKSGTEMVQECQKNAKAATVIEVTGEIYIYQYGLFMRYLCNLLNVWENYCLIGRMQLLIYSNGK